MKRISQIFVFFILYIASYSQCEDTRVCIKQSYDSQVGIRELTGHNDGRDVKKYLASCGLSEGPPWCAAFVNWNLQQCGVSLHLDAPAYVPSYFIKSFLIYQRGTSINKRQPLFGDLIGIWFESKGRLAHIGFFDKKDGDFYITVEGNTNEEGSREGDGVYKKRRLIRQIHSISSPL